MKSFILAAFAVLFSANLALAETKEFTIVIKDHLFVPAETKIPAGEKVKLIIDNQDSSPEEFESHDLSREKIISGNSKGIVFVGPLKAGTYKYFGEFNEATAQGVIIAE
jgi:plastocyanin